MKRAIIPLWFAALLAGAAPALAVDTTQVYTSGALVLLFVGFCALVVLLQVVPAALLFSQMISAVARLFSERGAKKVAQEE